MDAYRKIKSCTERSWEWSYSAWINWKSSNQVITCLSKKIVKWKGWKYKEIGKNLEAKRSKTQRSKD